MPCQIRKWKPSMGYSTVPVKGGDEVGFFSQPPIPGFKNTNSRSQDLNVALNKNAILNEISRIGGELVTRIVVNRA